MSHITRPTSLVPDVLADGPVLTLAAVLGRIEADPTLTVRCRHDMISALRTLRRVLGTELTMVPADPAHLRQHIASACPTRVGVKPARWNGVRSLTLKALRRAGIATLPGRSSEGMSAEWERMSCRLPDPVIRFRLSRFLRFCSGQGIAPAQVDAGTFAAFHDALQAMSLRGKPGEAYRATCLAWNRAAESVPDWPSRPVPVPSFSRRYALDWDGFPASFAAEARAFLTQSGNQDPFADDYAPSVKPSTLDLRRKQILQIATALVLSGVPAAEITGLAVLVSPENAARALRFFRDRPGGKESKYLHQQALLLRTIARHWVKAPASEVDTLRTFAARLAPASTGMVDKNRAKLRQFDDPENVRRLLRLPHRVFDELEKHDSGLRCDALRAMYALAVELLLVAPMRISNLVGLQFGRHIVTIPGERGDTVYLRIPAAETKTGEPFEVLLRARTIRLLTLFMERYRDRLTTVASPALFASPRGGTRAVTSFGTGLGAFVLQETGLRINPHLFRHLAVKLVLDANPGDMETARRILGHRTSATTQRAYADRGTDAAFQRYGGVLDTLRASADAPVAVGPRRTRIGARK